jgi:hypothetical protein
LQLTQLYRNELPRSKLQGIKSIYKESAFRSKLRGNYPDEIKGGRIAKGARLELETKTGKSVITGDNYLPPARKPKQITKR